MLPLSQPRAPHDQALPIDTRDLSTEMPTGVALPDTTLQPSRKLYRVLLYLTGQAQPLVVVYQQTVDLGRRSPFGETPAIDLTDHQAYSLGVSRRHASITLNQDGCWIRDLGSVNGTWINGKRLLAHIPYSLTLGDEIWLGKLSLRLE
jgi:pSer/pThr/pTyr-binding forkhead associated (FHA) protein